MNATEAIAEVGKNLMEGLEQVKRLLSKSASPQAEVRTVVVFTGYGFPLADHARDLSAKHGQAAIYIVGPDNNCAFEENDRQLDAVCYERHIREQDWADGSPDRAVVSDASKATSTTKGQATVTAQWLEQRRLEDQRKAGDVEELLLVTAAYHQPRAYMTLLKALIKRGLADRFRLLPSPYRLEGDTWDSNDPALRDKKTWEAAFVEDELPRILEYQRKGDVAQWKELKEHLDRIEQG